VYITPARDKTLDLVAISPAVRSGGARVVRTRITAKGVVEEGSRFRIDGWPVAYPLEDEGVPTGARLVRAGVRFPDGSPTLYLLDE